MAGRGKADVQATRAVHVGAYLEVLREVLYSGPGAPRGGVHQVLVLPASEEGSGARMHTVQREHGRFDSQLYCAR